MATNESLFCMEIFVDTVDYCETAWSDVELEWPAEACTTHAAELCFMFPRHAPVVIPAPNARRYPHCAKFVYTRAQRQRLRCTYQEVLS